MKSSLYCVCLSFCEKFLSYFVWCLLIYSDCRLKVKWTSLQWKKLDFVIVWVSLMVLLHQFLQRNYHLTRRSVSTLKFRVLSAVFITIYYLMQSMIEKLRNYSYLICDYVYFDNSGKTSLYLGIFLRIISAI